MEEARRIGSGRVSESLREGVVVGGGHGDGVGTVTVVRSFTFRADLVN